jgi:transposase
MPIRKTKPMQSWNQITHYAGFDWARDHHDVIVLDRFGQIVADFRIEHTAEGWQEFREKIQAYPLLALAIETSQGMAIDQLQLAPVCIYPVNPMSAQRYRERHVTSGNKTDRFDAWSLADALRTDGQHWKALVPLDPLVQELRLLCRDEMELIAQRTSLVNQLQQALHEYHPAALEAFDDWTQPYAWDFILQFPTPEALTKAGPRRWESFLHTHKLWRPKTVGKRLEAFKRAPSFVASAPVTGAKSLLARSLSRSLKTLQAQLDEYAQRIAQLFQQHPDHHLFGSLPGVGEKLGPRLLGEVGTDQSRFPDPQALQCLAGTAPVSYQSGQIHKVHLRRQCIKILRHVVHLWSANAAVFCPWAKVYYQKKRAEGKSHACALRCLGQRLLKILWKMIATRTPYDADFHARNQQRHGSWVLQLMQANRPENR